MPCFNTYLIITGVNEVGAETANPPPKHALKVAGSLIRKIIRFPLRILVLLFITISLSGCDWIEKIAQLIEGAKGDRAVSFLTYEPYKYEADDKGEATTMIGFNDETKGLEEAYKKGVKDAAGKRPWANLWYDDRIYMASFYDQYLKSEDTRVYLRDHLLELRKTQQASACEALICTFVISKPNNPNAYEVVALAYDLKQDKIALIKNVVSKEQSTRIFREDMGRLVFDLCAKLYPKP